jgi:1-acyl-sn-glycerol-3-phosphate acyltransferase
MADSGAKIGDFVFERLPHFFLEGMRKYFRVQVEGAEHLPKDGAFIVAPNHSGFSGLDAMILMHEIRRATGRLPKVMAHRFWFMTSATAIPLKRLGFVKASFTNGTDELKKGHVVMIFPEGEMGNFKPSSKAYQLQEFKRGFVRMAIETGAPIIPTMIIGAEESHITLDQLKLPAFLQGMILPIPLNLIPLPAKWKIKFLPALELPYKPSSGRDSELIHEIAEDIQEQVQAQLRAEVQGRKRVFF